MHTLEHIQAREAQKAAKLVADAQIAADAETQMTAREAAGKLTPSSWGA